MYKLAMHFVAEQVCHHHRLLYPARFCGDELLKDGLAFELESRFTKAFERTSNFDGVMVHGVQDAANFVTYARWRANNKNLIWNIDDDYWSIPDWSDAATLKDQAGQLYLANLLADKVCLSTRQLLDAYNQRNISHCQHYYCPNLIDPTLYVPRWQQAERPWVRVLWQGSRTHREDLVPLIEPITQVLTDLPEHGVEFLFWGDCHPELRRRHLGNGIGELAWVPPQQYHSTLASLAPDIVLAPLAAVPFNESKSALRIYEAWAAGAAVIASPVGNYYSTVGDGYNGKTAYGSEDWTASLKRLILNADERLRLAKQGHADVQELYNWRSAQCRKPWLEMFRSLIP